MKPGYFIVWILVIYVACQPVEPPLKTWGSFRQIGHIVCLADSALLVNKTWQKALFHTLNPPPLAQLGIDTLWHLHFVAIQDYALFLKNLNTEIWILTTKNQQNTWANFTPEQQKEMTQKQYLALPLDLQKGKKRFALAYFDNLQFSQILQNKQADILKDLIITDNERLKAFWVFHEPLQKYIQKKFALALPIPIYFDVSQETTTEVRLKNYKSKYDIAIWIQENKKQTHKSNPTFWEFGQKISLETTPNHWKFYNFVQRPRTQTFYKISLIVSKKIPKNERLLTLRLAFLLFNQIEILS
ncbi:MAG: hypothetical protein NZ551_11865 [Microscillaceae bacterium]|nr:hypothetical protein [Microscillaceae bacterium]MDW8461891.1 hypothetical protein [Cytophagales bacterium]